MLFDNNAYFNSSARVFQNKSYTEGVPIKSFNNSDFVPTAERIKPYKNVNYRKNIRGFRARHANLERNNTFLD